MLAEVTAHRRFLHQIPELDVNLSQTLILITGVLRGCRCEYFSPTDGCVCVWFDFGRPETVAFRADMDALPVQEATGAAYSSRHPGAAHADGHDGHAAMALSLAQWISGVSDRTVKKIDDNSETVLWRAREENFPRNILIIFQPSRAAGGADVLCRTGILRRYHVSRVFALKLWPGAPEGVIASRPGALMARSNEINIQISGESVHFARADEGRDALLAGVEFLRRAREMADAAPPPCILRFGVMNSGDSRDMVSGQTELKGVLRTYRDETYQYCRESLIRISGEISRETGCPVSVGLSDGWDAVWNPEDFYCHISNYLSKRFHHAQIIRELDNPVLASEDFAFYQQRAPGILFFLGLGDAPELYSPAFDFHDEIILPAGLEFLKQLALCE